MPRQKSFDEHQALREIGTLFWRHGYCATGLDQICTHLSLTKPSIYNTFGDKATLFRRVVDSYADDMLERGAEILQGAAPVAQEFTELLRYFLVLPDSEVISRGCLLTTSMLELQHSEPELFNYVRKRIDRVPQAFKTYLLSARDAGRLKPDCDPEALSQYLITLFQGLRMQSRTHAQAVDLERVIALGMKPVKDAEPDTAALARWVN